ncbi:MAG: HIT domain-containing protein [Actinobacteria bacterium]|nr:HIT domain-containing protein [Actinomycetota bacterium]
MAEQLDRLWAGWRAAYLAGDVDTSVDCVLCAVIEAAERDGDQLVFAGDLAVVLLNAFPYNSGHVLVLPRRHIDVVDALSVEEHLELWSLVRDATTAIKTAFMSHGINIGVNEGAAAGAGLPDHLHAHVLPRWAGDTNFMTATTSTRVMPEDLATSAVRLRNSWPTDRRPLA